MQAFLVVFIGLEAISAHHAIKKRQHSSLIVLFVLMVSGGSYTIICIIPVQMLHLALLCYHLKYVTRILFETGEFFIFFFLKSV